MSVATVVGKREIRQEGTACMDYPLVFAQMARASSKVIEGHLVPKAAYERLALRCQVSKELLGNDRPGEAECVAPVVARRVVDGDAVECECCWGPIGGAERFCPNCGAAFVGNVGVDEALERPLPSVVDALRRT